MYVRKHETGNLAAGDLSQKEYYILTSKFGEHVSWHKQWKAFVLKPKIKVIRRLHKMFPDAEWDENIFLDMKGVIREHREFKGVVKRIAKLKAIKKHEITHLDYEFLIPPWEHQKRGFRLVVNCPAIALLWDMRTGKTFTVVTAMEFLKLQGLVSKVLVLCPKHIRINWVDDVQEHTNLKSLILKGNGAKPKIVALRRSNQITVVDGPHILYESGNPDLIIVNHDAIRNKDLRDLLMAYNFDSLIVDESHLFRGWSAQRTKALMWIKRRIPRRYILTGTIIAKSPQCAYAQMKILYDEIFKESYETFSAKYCRFIRKQRFIQIYIGPKKHKQKELWKRIDAYADKVRIEDCHDMPDRMYNTVYVEMTEEEKKAHDELLEECMTEIQGKEITTSVLLRSRKLTQITSGFIYTKEDGTVRFKNPSKLESLKGVIQPIVDEGKKAIIWVGFHESVRLIVEMLKKEKIGHAVVSGYGEKMTAERRHQEVWRFRKDKKVQVMVANPSMLGVGMDLSDAMYAIYYENDYRLDFRLQSEARIYGDKSKEKHGNKIIYIDLIAKGSIDRLVLAALKGRKEFLAFINKKLLRRLKGSK